MRSASTVRVSPPHLDRDIDVLHRAVAVLQERLPTGWSADATYGSPSGDSAADAVVELRGPDQVKLTLVMAYKRSLVTRDLAGPC